MSDSETVRQFARLAADAVVGVHFAFVVFVGAGGFLAWRWRRVVWAHVPVVFWGALIEFVGWTCPLTPLENHFRRLAGQSAYQGSFIEHHILSMLYPVHYTMTLRILLGVLVVGLNVIAYGGFLLLRRRGAGRGDSRSLAKVGSSEPLSAGGSSPA